MRRYVTDVVAQGTTTTAGLFILTYNRSTATGGLADCASDVSSETQTLLPPGIDTATGGRFAAEASTLRPTTASLTQPLIVPSGNDLCVLVDGVNPVTVQLSGYLAP